MVDGASAWRGIIVPGYIAAVDVAILCGVRDRLSTFIDGIVACRVGIVNAHAVPIADLRIFGYCCRRSRIGDKKSIFQAHFARIEVSSQPEKPTNISLSGMIVPRVQFESVPGPRLLV